MLVKFVWLAKNNYSFKINFFLILQIYDYKNNLTYNLNYKYIKVIIIFVFISQIYINIFNKSDRIEVKTKRIGGAYGGKATNSLVIALATALGAYVTGRPCRFHADLKTCMATLGSRLPYSLDYKLGEKYIKYCIFISFRFITIRPNQTTNT